MRAYYYTIKYILIAVINSFEIEYFPQALFFSNSLEHNLFCVYMVLILFKLINLNIDKSLFFKDTILSYNENILKFLDLINKRR
jgi:hypothetical protein